MQFAVRVGTIEAVQVSELLGCSPARWPGFVREALGDGNVVLPRGANLLVRAAAFFRVATPRDWLVSVPGGPLVVEAAAFAALFEPAAPIGESPWTA